MGRKVAIKTKDWCAVILLIKMLEKYNQVIMRDSVLIGRVSTMALIFMNKKFKN